MTCSLMFDRSTASVTSTSCSSVSVICARTSWLYRVGCHRVTNRGDVKWSFVVYSCITMCFSCVYCGGGRYLYSGGDIVCCRGFLV